MPRQAILCRRFLHLNCRPRLSLVMRCKKFKRSCRWGTVENGANIDRKSVFVPPACMCVVWDPSVSTKKTRGVRCHIFKRLGRARRRTNVVMLCMCRTAPDVALRAQIPIPATQAAVLVRSATWFSTRSPSDVPKGGLKHRCRVCILVSHVRKMAIASQRRGPLTPFAHGCVIALV